MSEHKSSIPIPFFSTARQHARLADALMAASNRVIQSNSYILGPELLRFEQAWAQYNGVAHAVGVANGTDAISIALMACGVGPGDEVITAINTSPYTALAIAATGATPVFVDIAQGHYTLDVDALPAARTSRTRAIVPVHLYGQPADLRGVLAFAQAHGLRVIEDACQAHGAMLQGQRVGGFGDMGAFSFYPTKNLGALGDAGAIVTNDGALAERVRQLRNGGRVDRDHHMLRGVNSRLDEMQAALLSTKLPYLDEWNARRRAIAQCYNAALATHLTQIPAMVADTESACHLYVLRTPQRDALRQYLSEIGIATLIHYPIPLHRHTAFKSREYDDAAFPLGNAAAGEIVSLPLYPELLDDEVNRIIDGVVSWTKTNSM